MQLSTSSASRDSQAGFALMEAVIAAAVLMVVILGVLKGLDTANRSSGREKARAVASALTEQDQERLRSFRAVDLSNYEETRSVVVNNVTYTIDSKAEWVRDSTGGTESCNSSTTQADYMRVESTTSSGFVATPIPPITMASLVAAPIGAFGTNQGTLGVQVNDRDGAGVPGMPVTISGPASMTNETNSVGCAIFAYVPVGTYTARLNEAGWVDQGGATNSSKGATVTDGDVSITTMTYDRAASVQVSFDTVTARDGLVSAKGTSVSGSNSSVPAGPFSSAAGLRLWDPAGSVPQTSIDATSMFPFSDGYGMFAGACGGADPTNTTNDIDDYYDTNPGAYVNPEPGLASPPITLRMPSTNLKVLRNGAPIPIVQPVHIVFTSRTPGCTEKFELSAATDANGWVNTPALPFGDYQVCVDNTRLLPLPIVLQKKTTTVNIQNRKPGGILPAPVIDLGTGPSLAGTSATGSACS